MTDFPSIRPIASQEELNQLLEEAAQDKHTPMRPTHIFWKRGQIVGYASICALVPLIPGVVPQEVQFHTWFHSRRLGPRDSFTLINSLENIMACSTPAKTALVPVSPDSPFDKVMTAMGYLPLMDTRLWAKTFR